MGNLLGITGEEHGSDIVLDIDTLERECDDMLERYRGLQRIDHWSVIEWYRTVDQAGRVGPPVQLREPLLVVPDARESVYRLVDRSANTCVELPHREVAEFEDTLFCARMLDAEWRTAIDTLLAQ